MTNGADNKQNRAEPEDGWSKVLSRAYREAVEHLAAGPGRSIDDAIKTAAHRAVEGRSRTMQAAKVHALLRRLRAPLALAATVLLAIGIVFRLYRTGEIEIALPHAPEQNQIDKEPQKDSQPIENNTQSHIDKQPRADEPGETHPPLAPSSQDRSAANQESARNGALTRKAVPPPSRPTDNEERTPVPETGPRQSRQFGAEVERREAEATARPFPGAPGPKSSLPEAGRDATVPRSQMPGSVTAPTLSTPGLSPRDRTEAAELENANDAASTEIQLLETRLEGRSPEAWIEEIRILKAAGKTPEAAELLTVFRKKFPSFALPEDLK
jgi:hypothetical protein